MLYIQNRADSTLGVIEDFYNDTHQMILSSGVSSYTFTVAKNIEDAEYLVEGNYIVVTDDIGMGWKFTIMNTSQTHTEITVYCEDIGLELVNKVMDAWSEPSSKQPVSYYINKAIKDTKWKIGLNQIDNLSRTLKWEGRDTSLNRLLSICTEFDHAEIEFKVRFRNLQVTDYLINIYKKRGANRSDIQLVYGDTVNDITKTSSIEELATALMGVGSDKELPENSPAEAVADKTTFKDLTYDDGLFFTKAGDKFLRARVANQQFNLKEGYIEDFYEYDTADPQELLNRTITQLKERSEIKVNYEVSVAKFEKTLQLGDTITIIDHDYKPELLLSGRVLEMDKSYTDPFNNTLVLGNFLILYSNINDRLTNLQNQIKNMKLDSNHMWLRYAIDDKGNGMSATPTAETKYFAMLVNKKTGIPSDNPADYAGHWKLIQGADGKDGIPGATGADGKTSYTHFAYANNVSGTTDFSLDDPTGRSYMGVYSDFTKADSNDSSDYVWSLTKGESGPEGMQGAQGPKGDIGIPGKPGADGKTSYTHVAYADNDNGGGFSQNPTNKAYMGWYSDFTANDSTDPTKYAWSLIKGSDGLDGAQGIPGPKGADGKTPYTHIAYADTAIGGGLSQLPDGKKYIGMYVDFTENDSSDPQKYAWSLIKGADGKDGTPGKDGIAGKDGIGIKSTNVTYQASSNGTTAPTGAWTANVPTVPAGQYLWTRTIWTYTDNTNETSYSVAYIAKDGNSGKDGIAGKDGVGIKSTTITYATSTSGTVTPTTGWVTNPPAVSPGQFMWTKTVWNYTDNSSETGYSVAQAGNTGATGPVGKDGIAGKDGVGIKSTAIAYAQSTSGTTPPTTGWTAGVPTLIKGQYLWTKTVWTYTDSSAETGYTVSYNAKDGNTGADGIAGKDGVGISNTIIDYVGAVSGTSNPTSGWSTTIPAVPAGQYLWTRTTWQYTDGTSEQGFTNALMGRTGPKGDTGAQGLQGLQGPTGTQGIAGPKGADGKTSYTHIAYGTSNSGAGFTQIPSTSTTYIGMYVDQTATDSGDPNKYAWSLIKGADGTQGTPGAKGADGKTPYFHSAWANSVDGKTGFSTTDSVNKSYLGTYTDFTVADSADYTKYAWSLIKGADGINGKDGIPGKPGADGRTPYFHTAWADSMDGKINFSLTDATNRGYLGTYTDFTQADSTDTTKYAWSLIKGRDGSDGAPGKAGTDGKTPYFHQAWADSKDGKINFSATDPTNRGYLGTYSDFTQADSTDPSKYFWVELVGNLQVGVRNLLNGTADFSNGLNVSGANGTVITDEVYNGNRVLKEPQLTASNSYHDPYVSNTIDVAKGEYYALSFYARADVPSMVMRCYFYSPTNTISSINNQGFESTSLDGLSTFTITNQWKQYWVVWKTNINTTVKRVIIGRREKSVAGSDTGAIFINSPMLVEGNKAVGWQPAPEDTQGQIDSVNQALVQANNKINAVPHVSAQSSAPTNPKQGDQWWVLDESGKATGFKVWSGTDWADSKIQQSLLNVVSLNAVTITGSTINGSKFTNNFDFTNADKIRFQGVTTIGDGAINITWKIPANNQTGQTLLNASGFQSVVNDSDGAIINRTDLLFGELDLKNRTSGTGATSKYVGGSLTAQDVYRGDTTSVQWLSGWGDWGNGNGLIHVTRNGYTVSVSGYPHHNNSANFAEVATLPAWARPPKTVNLSGTIYDSGVMNPAACKITIDQNGKIQVTNGKKGGYLIIGGTYVGQNIV